MHERGMQRAVVVQVLEWLGRLQRAIHPKRASALVCAGTFITTRHAPTFTRRCPTPKRMTCRVRYA